MTKPHMGQYNLKHLLTLLGWLVFQTAVFAQTTIKGMVVDAGTGEPLIGASIAQKGTHNHTRTNIEGFFLLHLQNDSDKVLVASYTGFATQEISVLEKSNLTIKLNSNVPACIYIPIIPKNKGATKKITPDHQRTGGFVYPYQLLQNEVAGLNISRPGDDPNEDYFPRLRGISSFQMRSTPLIVVDGLPQASAYLIDPSDIASFKVLKDAASAAKYGILGHAGVVEINTHQYVEGDRKLSVDYRTYLSGQFLGREIPIANREQFLNAGGTDIGHETDWVDQITRTGISHGHHLHFKNRFRDYGISTSLGYRGNQGVLKKSGFEQMNGRVSFNAWPDEDLQLLGQLAFTKRDINYSVRRAFDNAITMNPTAPVRLYEPFYEEFGYYYHSQGDGDNPVAMLENTGSLERIVERTGYLKGIFDLDVDAHHQLFANLNITERDHIKAIKSNYQSRVSPRRLKGNVGVSLFNMDMGYAYSGLLGRFNWQQRAGLGFYRSKLDNRYQFGRDIFYDGPLRFSNINETLDKYSNNISTGRDWNAGHRASSFFSETTLNGNILDLTAYLRHNGLTYYNDDEWNDDVNYRLFFGATLGVDLNQLPLRTYDVFDEAKLRFSYGRTGGLYEARNVLPYEFRFLGDQNFNTEWRPFNMKEDDLIQSNWAEKKEVNIGFDFATMSGRLNGSIDVYQNQLNDLLVKRMWWLEAFGEMTNSGVEVEIHHTPIWRGDLRWEMGLFFSHNKSVIGRFSTTTDLEDEYDYIWLENGKEAGRIFAYLPENELIDGTFRARDLNGDGRIIFSEDTRIIGSGLPKINLGWQNTFTYGPLSLHFKLRSQLGHRIANGYRFLYEKNNAAESNIVISRYFNENLSGTPNFVPPTYFEKGDFLKLDYLNLGYDLPLKKGKCHLYLSGQNLLTLTGYTGLDPEARYAYDGSTLRPGVEGVEDEYVYYRNRVVTFGMQAGW